MNSRFNLLRIINQQPNSQFANKVMRKRMQDAREFAMRIRGQREERWSYRGKVQEPFSEMDDGP